MNYAELTAAVASYLQSYEADFTANLPVFVQQCEQRVYNTVQFAALRKSVVGTLTNGNKFYDCPSDFLSAYSFAVVTPSTGAYNYLLNKDVNFIREAYPVPTDTGVPKYYALFGPQAADEQELRFILGPTPNASYATELDYFFYPESIVTAENTWLGDNFDSVLLYGTLVEAYTYLKGEADLMQLYDGKYKEALAMAKRLGDGLERQDAYRSGQARDPVT